MRSPHSQDNILIEDLREFPPVRIFCYEARLKKMYLWSLEDRRFRTDFTEVYKITVTRTVFSEILQYVFEYSLQDRTRRDSLKLNQKRATLNLQ